MSGQLLNLYGNHNPAEGAGDQLRRFEAAVEAYSKARSELISIGAAIAQSEKGPTLSQRRRLKELSKEHFMAGEELKAIAMTLMGNGLLACCGVILDDITRKVNS